MQCCLPLKIEIDTEAGIRIKLYKKFPIIFNRKKMGSMHSGRGIYWEKNGKQLCRILFDCGSRGICIGSDISEGPDLIINTDEYVYLCITGANTGSPNDYLVIEDFDGPVKLRHSGFVYDLGTQRIQLL